MTLPGYEVFLHTSGVKGRDTKQRVLSLRDTSGGVECLKETFVKETEDGRQGRRDLSLDSDIPTLSIDFVCNTTEEVKTQT